LSSYIFNKSNLIMKNTFLAVFVLLGSAIYAQNFKDELVINGISYAAVKNTPEHATYIQQDNFDFSLAADSFYIDVMTENQWAEHMDFIVKIEGAELNNGIYRTSSGCDVFVGDFIDKSTNNLLIYRLFGSIDVEQ
jgi:hypothetical protein